MQKFKAAIFDFDGTVTEKGIPEMNPDMINTLIELAKKMPIGFCTGRNLESFLRRGLDQLTNYLNDDDRDEVLKNIYLLAENGSVGYFFNTDINNYEEFYRIDWPESLISMEKLKLDLSEKVKPWGELFYNAHKAVVVYRTVLYDVEDHDADEIYAFSRKIYEVIVGYLESVSENYENFLHVGDAGLGVLIIPADGDKDAGIKRFAQYFSEKFNTSFGKNLKDIMVVGDRPQKSGNDYYLLNSGLGTPFTVGDLGEGEYPPTPVTGEDGERIFNGKGTLHLIKKVLKEFQQG